MQSGTKPIAIAEAKTNYYASHGPAGLLAVFTKGMLCNWMVSLAVVAAFMSTSFSGKILAIWGPTLLFFSQGFEHAVVNMFLIPVGMILGANVSLSTWWLWNQIPVTLGNLVGACCLPGWRFMRRIVAQRLPRRNRCPSRRDSTGEFPDPINPVIRLRIE